MSATVFPTADQSSTSRPKWRPWLIAAAITVVVVAPLAIYFINANWPFRYRKIHPLLEDVFASQVAITSYHRTYWPNPGFVAEGLTLRRKSATDQPPIGHAQRLVVQGRWRDLFLLRQRVQRVEITGLHIVIPAIGSRALHENFPPGSGADFSGPDTTIEQMVVRNAELEILRDGSAPLSFPIRQLAFSHVHKGEAATYSVDMRNAIPTGQIQATGSFGPLNPHDIGATPVTGNFSFVSVNLRDVGNINGTLASTGHFRGPLNALETEADTRTPDFAVSEGKPTPVQASIQCTVHALRGDVDIHAIQARLGKTLIHATGSIAGSPNTTNLDLEIADGRAEDVMRPFIRDEVPITGGVRVRSHAYLAPATGGAGFLQRLHVNGTFTVPNERLTDHKTEESLTDFSLRAQGKKDPEPSHDPSTPSEVTSDAVSSIAGQAEIRNGVASSQHLTFRIPGADAKLAGTFAFNTKVVHLTGDLRMQSDISHATTGFKSFLLKPLAPFFKKKHAGAVVPIAVTGGPGHYQVSQDLTHTK